MTTALKSAFRIASWIGLGLVVSTGWSTFSGASSCCSGGGGQTICVLPAEHNYQLGVSASYRTIDGHYDPYGYYSENSAGTFSTVKTVIFGGAYRLNDNWQLGGSVPLVNNVHALLNGATLSATEVADPVVEARYSVWEDLRFLPYRPQLSLMGGLRVPVGASIYNSTDPYGTNVVGDGTYTVHIGVNASKTIQSTKLAIDGTFFYPISKRVSEMKGVQISNPYFIRLGNRFQTTESVIYLFNEKFSAGASLKQFWQLETSINGEVTQGSAARLFTSGLSFGYFMNRSLSFAASVETVAPFYQYIANQPGFTFVAINASYGGF